MESKKQLSMETLSPGEALNFAAVRERGELMNTRVSGGLPRFGKNLLNGNRKNNPGSNNLGQRGSYVKREPVSGVNNQVLDKCHNCGNPLTPNHRNYCKAKNIICKNCSCRGHFPRFCKTSVNQIDGTYELTQYETIALQASRHGK